MKTTDADILQRFGRSHLFSEFKNAFGASTGLPLSLRPFEYSQLAHRNQPYENRFCAMIAQTNRGCLALLEAQQRAVSAAQDGSATIRCFANLCHTAVPVKLGERTIGFLLTGQVSLDLPSPDRFKAIVRQLTDWGVTVDLKRLEDAYYHSRVLSPEQYAGLIRLLVIFGQQLSAIATQMMVQDPQKEPLIVRRARAYIAGHHANPISLDDISRALHVSAFYFCKIFKKATGLTFTEYLGRFRVEKAKKLLLNPHLRVNEIAYSVGFQSLTHFNRIFREITGQAPTRYRDNGTGLAKGTVKNRGAWHPASKASSEGVMPLAA